MLRVGDGYLLSEYVWKVIRVGDDDDECLFDVGQLQVAQRDIELPML